jgi:succinyl-diaminopimelate desuccinylase
MLEYLKEQKEELDACIVGEPTNPLHLGEMIKIGRRGSISFVLTIHGTQGHVAYPKLADNPIPRAIHIMHALTPHALDEGTEFFDPSNLEVTSIDVGNPAVNVIPASVRILFNIRFNDLHHSSTLIKWVETICQSLCETGDSRYELTHHISGESFLTKPGALSDVVSTSVEHITGKKPILSTTGGTSDARFIKDYCPVVECGLINQTAHKVDECARVSDIHQLTKIYHEILKRYFR